MLHLAGRCGGLVSGCKAGLAYKELADRLQAAGGEVTSEKVLRTKLARGSFSAAFFLEVLSATGAKSISLDSASDG